MEESNGPGLNGYYPKANTGFALSYCLMEESNGPGSNDPRQTAITLRTVRGLPSPIAIQKRSLAQGRPLTKELAYYQSEFVLDFQCYLHRPAPGRMVVFG